MTELKNELKFSQQIHHESAPNPIAWTIIIGFVLILSLAIFLAPSKILLFSVPIGAFLVGLFLYNYCPLLYVEFVLWVGFLSPLVRRLIDYRVGFTNPNPVLLAPYVVILPTIYSTFRYLPRLDKQGGAAFLITMIALLYGFVIGLLKSPTQEVLINSLEWVTPVMFGWYLVLQSKHYIAFRYRFQRTFFWCVLLTGSYGIYQYVVAPEWDTFWLTHMIEDVSVFSFGNPNPLEIRVWGTMHGPFVFAVSMSAGLLLLMSRTEPMALTATVVGLLACLLTQVRTSWLGLMVGIIVLLLSMRQSIQVRLVLTIMMIAGCVISLSMMDPFSEVIAARFSSLSDVQQDSSAVGRSATYLMILNQSLVNFMGDGFSKSMGGDSGLLDILIRLGWIGGLPYFIGLALLVCHPMNSSKIRSDIFARTTNAIVIGLIAQIPLGAVMVQVQGVVLWGFIGMKLAAWKYHSSENLQCDS
jgi:hypothetical protein